MSDDKTLFAQGISRRLFLAAAGAAAVAPALAQAQAAGGQKIRLGLIGCGGRGSWIAGLFQKHGGYELTACADYFQDRADAVGAKFNIPAERRFTTLSGYKRLLELKDVDAVAIISPPYFHPEQAAAALDAGKHVYLAKPIAVDVPGCQSVAESGKKATEKKLVMLVDFQTRANPFYQEALKRVHEGALGTIAYGQSMYHTGRLGRHDVQGNESEIEKRLRNWVFDIRLSGDIIVEQNIHTLDVMNWVMQAPPLQCTGTGGRKGRIDVGDCWDHYACVYEYPDSVGFTFSSRQYDADGDIEGIILNAHGSKGALITRYGGRVAIRGGKGAYYAGGDTKPIYQEGAQANIAAFHKAVLAGDCANATVPPSVQSNLIAILGRTATRRKQTVTWQQMLETAEKVDGDLRGLKA